MKVYFYGEIVGRELRQWVYTYTLHANMTNPENPHIEVKTDNKMRERVLREFIPHQFNRVHIHRVVYVIDNDPNEHDWEEIVHLVRQRSTS